MKRRFNVFISSVQKELEPVRAALKAFLLGDAMLKRFVADVFLFEDLPASDRRVDEVYLAEVERCDLYLGIFGYEYGWEDAEGISPTEREYDHATKHRKTRFVYVWGSDDSRRHPKMAKLIGKASNDLIRRRVDDQSALTAEVYASLVDFFDQRGLLRTQPFDTAACDGATTNDLSRTRISWFLDTARRERNFPLKANTSTKALLTHLQLLAGETPTNAAMLLFGREPQRFHTTALAKCIHNHGTSYRRPFASLQVYNGDLFEQADQARDFVLAKINRPVGTRAESITAPASYELPPDAVAEAIINALAHRDYTSNASVEIRLFADRLEVWNPGALPGTLSFEDLRTDHPSVPYNPLIAEPLYLARYIERAGSGTQTMIELCREAGLPEPTFQQREGFFVTTLWRDWMTAEFLASFALSERLRQALELARTSNLTSGRLQEATGVSRQTAARDLDTLVRLGLLEKTGRGRWTTYARARSMPHQ
jgi:predicted HTH transcriptional regulator